MILLESAIKAHRSLVKKGKGTIESRYKNAEIVYKKISEIVNSYGSSEVGIGLLGEACYGGV